MILASVVGKVYNVEILTSKAGNKYARGSLRDVVKNKDGEFEGRFIKLTVFGNDVDTLQALTTNDTIVADGILDVRTYEDKNNATKVSIEMTVKTIRRVYASKGGNDNPENVEPNETDEEETREPVRSAPSRKSGNPFS